MASEHVANLLAEVKLAEKKLGKLEERASLLESQIRGALRGGDRPRAEKLALELEQLRAEMTELSQRKEATQRQFEEAKAKTRHLRRTLKDAERLGATAQALGQMNAAMDVAAETDELVRAIDEQVALSDAKLELASEAAAERAAAAPVSDPEDVLRRLEDAPPTRGAGDAPPARSAEDVLRELEERE